MYNKNMKNYLTNTIKILSVGMALVLVSCSSEGVQEQPATYDQPLQEITIIAGNVASNNTGELTLTTADGDVTLNTSEAAIYGEISQGVQVEALVTGNVAEFVSVANENNPVINLSGYVVSVDDESITVLSGGKHHSFDTTGADILLGKAPAVGDAVNLISTEGGKAIEIKITAFGGGRINGELTMLTDTIMVVTLQGGANIPFLTQGIVMPEGVEVGQEVLVDYHGTLSGKNNAVALYLNESELPTEGEISGVVSDLLNGLIAVRTDAGEIFSFVYEIDNTFTGNRLLVGDSVDIAYSLNSSGTLNADTITPTAYSARGSYNISGVVTGYDPGLLTIRTENGNSYSFSHNDATAIYGESVPVLGDEVKVVFELNDNNFLRCTALYIDGFEPQTQTVTGDVVNIETDIISIVDDQGTEVSFYYSNATLNSSLPIMRSDNITIEYIEVPSGNSDAVAITFNSTATQFEPQPVSLQETGVVQGEIILKDDDMLFIKDDDGRLFLFTTDNAEFVQGAEEELNVYVQYIGDTLNNPEAVLISPFE